MSRRHMPTILLLLAAAVGCEGGASSTDPPTTSHVFEDLLAALDIEDQVVGVHESWENIPDPDLAAEIREYAEKAEIVVTCDSWSCAGPEHSGTWIKFDAWLDPALRDSGKIKVTVEEHSCLCGPIFAVEITRTDAGGWQVEETAEVGMWMS